MTLKRIEDVTPADFFVSSVMNQVTDFKTFDEFLKASGFGVSTAEEFDALPQKVVRDKFVSDHSQFSSWDEMVDYFRNTYFGY